MGASNPHPHGQVWASSTLPTIVRDPTCYLCPGNERANGSRNPDYAETFVFPNDFAALKPRGMDDPKRSTDPLYAEEPVRRSTTSASTSYAEWLTFGAHRGHGAALLSDYAAQEVAAGERLVLKDRDWVVVVPFWATWPFETILISRAGRAGFADLSTRERSSLAVILGELLAGYDAVFDAPFPYSMGWHPSPASSSSQHWVLHAHIYPPLLRAEARKFLVGYEMLAEAQRDLTAEDAAARLRDATARSSRAPR